MYLPLQPLSSCQLAGDHPIIRCGFGLQMRNDTMHVTMRVGSKLTNIDVAEQGQVMTHLPYGSGRTWFNCCHASS